MLRRLLRNWSWIVGSACIFGSFWFLWKGYEIDRQWNERMADIDRRWNANSEQIRPEVEVLRQAKTDSDRLDSALKLATLQADKVMLRREEIETARQLFDDRGDCYFNFLVLWGIGVNVFWIGPFIARVRARWRRRAHEMRVRRADGRSDGENRRGARDAVGADEHRMDEAEWPVASNPMAMLEETGLTSERKLRLFAVACCRRVWEHLPGIENREAVEVAEQYADGEATSEQLDAACENAAAEPFASADHGNVRIAWHAARQQVDARSCALNASLLHAESLVPNTEETDDAVRRNEADDAESAAQADLLREIFGNPFRPVTLDPAWLTSTVTALARQMYDSRDFSAMPMLADALQDAGCDNDDVLNHCRGPGPHVRGCWVVDLVLGKE